MKLLKTSELVWNIVCRDGIIKGTPGTLGNFLSTLILGAGLLVLPRKQLGTKFNENCCHSMKSHATIVFENRGAVLKSL